MLAQALMLLLAVALVGATLATGTFAAARVSLERIAARSADAELVRAQQAAIGAIAAQVQQVGPEVTLVSPSTLPATLVCAPASATPAAPCALSADATVVLSGESGTASSGPLTASELEQTTGVQERRVALRVTATVRGADGSPLAVRTELLTLRTLAVAPYAVVTGVLDAAVDVSAEEEGDSGGATTGDDTRLHAVLVCRDGGAGVCNGATPRPADDYADQAWDSGNEPPAGWSR